MWYPLVRRHLFDHLLWSIFQSSYNTHITHIQDVHNIVGPLVSYKHACPKQRLIHQDRVMQLMKQALYLQATTAGLRHKYCFAILNTVLIKINTWKWGRIELLYTWDLHNGQLNGDHDMNNKPLICLIVISCFCTRLFAL